MTIPPITEESNFTISTTYRFEVVQRNGKRYIQEWCSGSRNSVLWGPSDYPLPQFIEQRQGFIELEMKQAINRVMGYTL